MARMSEPVAESGARKWRPLDPRQRRVLGVLIEKAKTTPAGYPMSVNAIVAGCNQKSNRDPAMSLDDFGVEKALDELRNMGAVSEVDWIGRVSKWKHHAYEWLGVSKPEIAVMTELLLRGAQTLGDLRARAARMEPIADLTELKPIISGLVERGLMVQLTPPGRGQMVSHNLYEPGELAEVRVQARGGPVPAEPEDAEGDTAPRPARAAAGAPDASSMTAEIAELRAEVQSLRAIVDDLRAKLGVT